MNRLFLCSAFSLLAFLCMPNFVWSQNIPSFMRPEIGERAAGAPKYLPAATHEKWAAMTRRHDSAKILADYAWLLGLGSDDATTDRRALLGAVLKLVSGRPYLSDAANYGLIDYWATTDEFLARGGDCEDAAIAGYFLLKMAGWNPADTWLVVLRPTKEAPTHAILLAWADGFWVELDIRNKGLSRWHGPPENILYALNENLLVF